MNKDPQANFLQLQNHSGLVPPKIITMTSGKSKWSWTFTKPPTHIMKLTEWKYYNKIWCIALELYNCNLVHRDCYCFYKVNQNFPMSVETQMSVYTRSPHNLWKKKTPQVFILTITWSEVYLKVLYLIYCITYFTTKACTWSRRKRGNEVIILIMLALKNIFYFFPVSPPLVSQKGKNKSRKWKTKGK